MLSALFVFSSICLSTRACEHVEYWCCNAVYELFEGELDISVIVAMTGFSTPEVT